MSYDPEASIVIIEAETGVIITEDLARQIFEILTEDDDNASTTGAYGSPNYSPMSTPSGSLEHLNWVVDLTSDDDQYDELGAIQRIIDQMNPPPVPEAAKVYEIPIAEDDGRDNKCITCVDYSPRVLFTSCIHMPYCETCLRRFEMVEQLKFSPGKVECPYCKSTEYKLIKLCGFEVPNEKESEKKRSVKKISEKDQ